MKHLIKKLLNEESIKITLLEELSLLIEKEISVGPALKKKLGNINKPFADKLLKFLTSDKISDKVTIDTIDYDLDDDKTITGYFKDIEGKKKARKFKVGKLLKYLGVNPSEYKGYEIEELISYLKQGSLEDFKVVDGEDILKAYHCDNYDEGETMGSCMRYEAAQTYLKMYVDNPDDVKCLVLLNPNNNKVRGRALLWHMDNDRWFMDRVYMINSQYRNLFNLYKEKNNFSIIPKTVTLTNGGEYDEYPYMDTFEFYSPSNGELSIEDYHDDSIMLTDTQGGYSIEEKLEAIMENKSLIKKLLREGLDKVNSFESLLGEVTSKLDFSSFKMNDTLNPEIWVDENTIKPEIQENLIKIAEDYYNNLELDIPILDITLTGSLANYNWSKYSDVDLHIIFDANELGDNKDMVKDLLDVKTRAWNLKHNITVKGFDVELYLQPEDQPHHSTGVYSLMNKEWVDKPEMVKPEIDKETITKKYNNIIKTVNEIKKCDDEDIVKMLEKLKDKIKAMRQSGLDSGGEFSNENIVFKLLRRNDIMEEIDDMLTDAYDKFVSLD